MVDAKLRQALKTRNQIRITVIGRKTGRKISLPVWFVLEGENLMLLPVLGTKTNWYKNLEKTPSVVIDVAKATLTAKSALSREASKVEMIAEMFRAKYGAGNVKRYYPRIDACVEIPLS